MKQDNKQKILAEAVAFAAISHRGDFRKGTGNPGIPLIVHPMETAAIVASMTKDPEVLSAAVLHDVLEDTKVTRRKMRARFNERICALVENDTEDKRKDRPPAETWWIRKQEALDKLKEASVDAKMIVLGDKLSNIRAIRRDQEEIGERVWERFNQNDPREQAKYYREIRKITEELNEYEAWKEFSRLVDGVFPSTK